MSEQRPMGSAHRDWYEAMVAAAEEAFPLTDQMTEGSILRVIRDAQVWGYKVGATAERDMKRKAGL